MKPIIYDVAVSIDGFISGPEGDISKFPHAGSVVDDYITRLETYSVAIMGKRTYEFGYQFGLLPGKNPYAHMKTFVFSKSIQLKEDSEVTVQATSDAQFLRELKTSSSGPIYLCGGGAFAGSLFSMGLIDILRLKRVPIILGDGVRLFENSTVSSSLQHTKTKKYDGGYIFQEFEVQ